jgi:hypothetical protein
MKPTTQTSEPITMWVITCSDGLTHCDILSGTIYKSFKTN